MKQSGKSILSGSKGNYSGVPLKYQLSFERVCNLELWAWLVISSGQIHPTSHPIVGWESPWTLNHVPIVSVWISHTLQVMGLSRALGWLDPNPQSQEKRQQIVYCMFMLCLQSHGPKVLSWSHQPIFSIIKWPVQWHFAKILAIYKWIILFSKCMCR